MTGPVRVARHLTVEEVKMRMKMRGGLLALQKWMVIYNALVDPRPVAEIAVHTGLAEGTVLRIIAEYNSIGPECLDEGRTEVKSRTKFAERLRRSAV